LKELAERFRGVTLTDHDAARLQEALGTEELDTSARSRIRTIVADLTGVTAGFLDRVEECLAAAHDPVTTAEHLAVLAESVRPAKFTIGQKYDLVVASCVLCQLHLETCNRTHALFARRYPGGESVLRQSTAWNHAVHRLARRMERTFLDTLYALVARGGRVYLSDTVQCAFLHAAPEGGWRTDGVHRLTPTNQLRDYLDARFEIERQASWLRVVTPSLDALGRLYDTQGLVLARTSAWRLDPPREENTPRGQS
jgi:hypothetical protein